MQTQPFALLRPFARDIDIAFLGKSDDVHGEDDVRRVLEVMDVMGPKQVHGNRAIVTRGPSWRSEEADAVFTDVPGLTLVISFADCQNCVLYAPKKRVVGVMHAGWRTVAADIITPTFALLKHEWNIAPQEVFIALGPSLCMPCAGFSDPKREVPQLQQFIRGQSVDLRAALESQLEQNGVPAEQIERMPDCTRCSPERYWTYRGGDREKVRDGFINCLAATLKKE